MQLTFAGMESVVHNHTATSISAAKRVRDNPEHRESDKERVMRYIESCGERGCTDQEIQAALGMSGDTERPRRYECHRDSRIKAAGTRTLPNGNRATVWVAVG